MSTTIDERVVEMRFDNKQFESNVSTSMSTLKKLKESLKFTGATKGLEEIDAASKRVNMSGLGGAVDSVKAKFSAMDVVAVTANAVGGVVEVELGSLIDWLFDVCHQVACEKVSRHLVGDLLFFLNGLGFLDFVSSGIGLDFFSGVGLFHRFVSLHF